MPRHRSRKLRLSWAKWWSQAGSKPTRPAPTSCVQGRRSKFPITNLLKAFGNQRLEKWWSQAGSNRRPPACKAGALPAELWPRDTFRGKPRIHRRPFLNFNFQATQLPHEIEIFSQVGRRRRRSVHQYARLRLRSRCGKMVGLGGFEPPTSPLSGVRSNQLSYRPGAGKVLPRLKNNKGEFKT